MVAYAGLPQDENALKLFYPVVTVQFRQWARGSLP